jgi:lipopolysaccharide transport system permease protein
MRTTRDKVELVAVGARTPSFATSLRLLWAHREVVSSFALRSLRVRYKQSFLGVMWAVIQPLAFLGLFVVFFGHVAKLSGGGVPYAAFALSALGPWQFVTSAVSFGGAALVNEASIMRKVYFPREAPVIGTVATSLVDLGIIIVLILIASPLLGGHFGLSLIWLPLLVLTLVIPALAVALPLAGMGVYYRDVKYVLPFLVQFWMFASPVAYPVSRVPVGWRPAYAALNPAVGPLESFRRVFALGIAPDWGLLAISAASGTFLLLVGYRVFKRLEPEMADVV